LAGWGVFINEFVLQGDLVRLTANKLSLIYLRRLVRFVMKPNEEKPCGLLHPSEGNTDHIELLMLDEKDIKVVNT
jgi:hypothetical protein